MRPIDQPGPDLASLLSERAGSDPAAAVVATVIESPVGPLVAATTEGGLCFLEFGEEARLTRQLGTLRRIFGPVASGADPILERTGRELGEYFDGRRSRFEVPLVIRGTPFQEQVWQALLRIPYGRTTSYGELARELGRPGAQRAVGLANGQNRLAIIVPCHRVIERGGGLRGYGGGLWRKRLLLDLEAKNAGIDALSGTPLGDAIR
jgi:AraC family transcriptional regulator of adaptative response/methylated-DNA-[protein]-cysteine methyltransferase